MNLTPAFALVANMGVNFPETGATQGKGPCAGNSRPKPELTAGETAFPFGRFFEIDCRLCLKPYSGYLPECPHCTHPQLVLE